MSIGIRNCAFCGKEILVDRQVRMKSKNVFCGIDCLRAFHKGSMVTCQICGKEFYVKKSSEEIRKTCSKKCFSEWQRIRMSGEGNHQYGLKGKKNPSWKSDSKISVYGYRLIRVPDHPFKNSDDMVFEHRLIADKYLLTDENSVEINGKRYLAKGYEVHHKDMNHLNNDLSNLVVLTKSQHVKLHCKLSKRVIDEKTGRFIKIIKPEDCRTPEEIAKITEEFLRSIA